MDILKAVIVLFVVVAVVMFLRDLYHAIIGDEENNG